MPDFVTSQLSTALSRPGGLDRLTFHALLHRLCSQHVRVLRDRLREPLWLQSAAAQEQEMRYWIEETDWASRFSRLLSTAEGRDVHRLVLCSSALRALDAHHRQRRIEVERQIAVLPPDTGGGRTAAAGWVNRCRVLDGFGHVLFEQDKCLPYRLPADQAADLPEELRALLGIDARGGFEDIELGSTLVLLDCALGRLATPICLDFSGDELRELFVRTGTNLLFVPAMTPRLQDFQARARDLGTQTRATTFVVNSSWLLRQMSLPSHGNMVLGYVPAKHSPKDAGEWLLEEAVVMFSIRELLGLAPKPS